MGLKTFKEFKNNKAEVVKSSSASIIQRKKNKKKTIIVEDDKEYYLQHADYPVICDCTFMLGKLKLNIEGGIIKTTDKKIKDELIQNGFIYLGYKKDGQAYI